MAAVRTDAGGSWPARARALVIEISGRIAKGIQDSPYAAVGVATGIGILLGTSVRAGPGRMAALAVASRLIRGGLAQKL